MCWYAQKLSTVIKSEAVEVFLRTEQKQQVARANTTRLTSVGRKHNRADRQDSALAESGTRRNEPREPSPFFTSTRARACIQSSPPAGQRQCSTQGRRWPSIFAHPPTTTVTAASTVTHHGQPSQHHAHRAITALTGTSRTESISNPNNIQALHPHFPAAHSWF